ncbi:MAG: hypothetical protein IE931_12040 [Sphingobacteriales bacterium]|nr:hypothetical protein [Sphingobacteriales bacterium]
MARKYKFHNNRELYFDTVEMLHQRLAYIHNNPVEQGFVSKPEEWANSSCAAYYSFCKSKFDLIFLNKEIGESSGCSINNRS